MEQSVCDQSRGDGAGSFCLVLFHPLYVALVCTVQVGTHYIYVPGSGME